MIIIAIVSLVLGIVCGQWLFSDNIISMFAYISDYVLYILMFAVGISVGINKTVFKKMREYNFTVIIIPIGIVVGTILGGIISGFILGMPIRESSAIAVGMGWYSLSGVLITDLAGAETGTIAFFSNLMREIFSFMLIPFIAKYFNHYTAIASAGATSEDTTLPMLIKYTSSEIVIMAVINGVICSVLVPVLTPFLFSIFSL